MVTMCFTWMTRDGPSATISAGIWLRGQFSMLMICRLEHSASSDGRLCRFTLSLMYSDSSFSNIPGNASPHNSINIPGNASPHNSTRLSPTIYNCSQIMPRWTACKVHQVAAPVTECKQGLPGCSNCEGVNVRFTRWQQYYHDVWCGRTADCDGSFFSILGWLLPYVTNTKLKFQENR